MGARIFANKYGFELAIIIIEIIAWLIVALTLLTLFGSGLGSVWAAETKSGHRRVIKLAVLPTRSPAQLNSGPIEPAEMYITVSEVAAPAPSAKPEQVSASNAQNIWPASTAGVPDTPLSGWPAPGALTQGFGCSAHYTGIAGPDCPTDQPWFHDGIDIGAWPGAPVRAALGGTVIFAGADGDGPPCGAYRGFGLGVMVDNGRGWQALYAHLAEIQVSVGQVVEPDTVIGSVGQTGCSSGPHLHFGLRHAGELVDPTVFRP
jgi:murein DD-endopeptidase MepM/ murein hydrolase activator NlpD